MIFGCIVCAQVYVYNIHIDLMASIALWVYIST